MYKTNSNVSMGDLKPKLTVAHKPDANGTGKPVPHTPSPTQVRWARGYGLRPRLCAIVISHTRWGVGGKGQRYVASTIIGHIRDHRERCLGPASWYTFCRYRHCPKVSTTVNPINHTTNKYYCMYICVIVYTYDFHMWVLTFVHHIYVCVCVYICM